MPLSGSLSIRISQLVAVIIALLMVCVGMVRMAFAWGSLNFTVVSARESFKDDQSLSEDLSKIDAYKTMVNFEVFTCCLIVIYAFILPLSLLVEKKGMLLFSSIFGFLLLVLAIISLILVLSFNGNLVSTASVMYNVSMTKYGLQSADGQSSIYRDFVDDVNIKGECCGLENYRDWKVLHGKECMRTQNFTCNGMRFKQPGGNDSYYSISVYSNDDSSKLKFAHVPFSCCKPGSDAHCIDDTFHPETEPFQIFTNGCSVVFHDLITADQMTWKILGTISIFLTFVEAVFASVLFQNVRDQFQMKLLGTNAYIMKSSGKLDGGKSGSAPGKVGSGKIGSVKRTSSKTGSGSSSKLKTIDDKSHKTFSKDGKRRSTGKMPIKSALKRKTA